MPHISSAALNNNRYYMMDMIETTAKKDRQRIAQIEKLMGTMGAEIQAKRPKVYS
jgi:hypothetical protein